MARQVINLHILLIFHGQVLKLLDTDNSGLKVRTVFFMLEIAQSTLLIGKIILLIG